jgi:hypothetical protein
VALRNTVEASVQERADRLGEFDGGSFTVELLLVVALWLVTWVRFRGAPIDPMYRIDYGNVTAYPSSDALDAYGSAIAVLVGDGWSNWEFSSRWTLCKVGWKAILVALAWLFDRDPAAMQSALTLLLASTGPAFYFFVRQLLPRSWGPFIGTATTIAFLAFPLGGSWWFERSMITEGPTLLLSLLVCGVMLRVLRTSAWTIPSAMTLGCLCGLLVLIRSQARFGLIPPLAAFAALAVRRPLGRNFLAATAICFAAATAPFYLKTSYHLGRPYLGTEICSLRAVLNWTPCGQAVGTTDGLPAVPEASEAEVLNALGDRVRAALRVQRSHPIAVAEAAVGKFFFYTHSQIASIVGVSWSSWMCLPAAATLFLGIATTVRRIGASALIPVLYAAFYMLPNALFSLYWVRHGAPISWLGPAYAAALSGAFVNEKTATRSAGVGSAAPMSQALAWLTAVGAAWTVLVTFLMLRADHSPYPSLDQSVSDPRAVVGHILLPIEIRPGNAPVHTSERDLAPRSEPYTSFLLVKPWKESGGYSRTPVWIRGSFPGQLRNGDRVTVVTGDDGEVFRISRSP